MSSRIVVTAAEFTRHFGQLRQEPEEVPVFVTHHGRETHVLLSKRRYDKDCDLSGQSRAQPYADALHDLVTRLPHAVLILDRRGIVGFANPAAHAAARVRPGEFVGRPVGEAVPALGGSLLEGYLRRVMRSGEPVSADIPSIITDGAWIQVEMWPADGSSVVVLLRDITEDVRRNRLADRDRAVTDAVRLHPGIGQAVLNVRGYIEAIDAAICKWLVLPAERLVNVSFADLIPSAGRAAFRERLDAVLRGAGPVELEIVLVSNAGDAVRMTGLLVELRGVYGSEGVMLIVTAHG